MGLRMESTFSSSPVVILFIISISSFLEGCFTMTLNMNRSSCASGKG